MATRATVSKGRQPGSNPAALAVVAGLVVVVLGVLGWLVVLAWPFLVTWLRTDLTLSGLVDQLLIAFPATRLSGFAATDVPRLQAAYGPALTALLAWVVVIMGFMLPMVTYQIYFLRKFMGWMQSRVGPTQVGPYGLLQTPADVIKLLTKEDVIPRNADRLAFMIAPFIVLVPASMAYLVIPFGNSSERYSLVAGNLNIGILYILAISSVAVIGIIAGGWASNNKYSLLGAMRSAAQLITYEIPMSLAALVPIIWFGTLNLQKMVGGQPHILAWGFWPWFTGIAAVLYFIAALAELGHIPFDLPEAESELVSGYNTEYSGMKFAMFFLAEFSNAWIQMAIFTLLFLGGWQSPFPASWPLLGWDHGIFALFWFFLKTFSLIFVLFWLRSTLPRLRIDQLMTLGWKFLIPVGLINLVVVAVLRALWPAG